MIVSFCKKGLHSFLGLANFVDSPPLPTCDPRPNASAVGLSTATADWPRWPNVVESTAVHSPPPPPKKDKIRGSDSGIVDGLMSCTESLGFESSDDLVSEFLPARHVKMSVKRTRWRDEIAKRREKKYPPPISSLDHKGQRSFFLRPVRTEGRLKLAEVRIDRPEILWASREDGRLRLHLIVNEEVTDIEEHTKMEEIGEKHEEEQEGQHEIGEWKIAVSSGDGFVRCHHPHNFQDVWRQPCVPTR
ncbi:hypothetical protein SAY87_015434 [Trapa incisa]|uniref:FAF domain-containing protein n=1 Tax=Trapa incisa TaxID=236973 RepID=A0AAN7GX77_9MYRT|nr:hypothetical protein SAY87_015434 [Trapa incisa]